MRFWERYCCLFLGSLLLFTITALMPSLVYADYGGEIWTIRGIEVTNDLHPYNRGTTTYYPSRTSADYGANCSTYDWIVRVTIRNTGTEITNYKVYPVNAMINGLHIGDGEIDNDDYKEILNLSPGGEDFTDFYLDLYPSSGMATFEWKLEKTNWTNEVVDTTWHTIAVDSHAPTVGMSLSSEALYYDELPVNVVWGAYDTCSASGADSGLRYVYIFKKADTNPDLNNENDRWQEWTCPNGTYQTEYSTSMNDSTVSPNHRYYYHVYAEDWVGMVSEYIYEGCAYPSPNVLATANVLIKPAEKATNPNPSSGATGQSIETNLSWSNGGGATSYDVYFGTNSTPDSSEYKGNQTSTSYDPGTLSYSTTYYWRIDASSGGMTTTGDVWQFTTSLEPPQLEISVSSLTPSCTEGENASNQSFEVWNSGGGSMIYTIGEDISWLSVSPASGSSTGEHDTITVSYDTSGLAVGSHTGTITVTATGANGSPKTINVTLTVNEDQTRVIRLEGQDNLSFGDVTVNTTATKTLTIHNDGNDTLTVTSVSYPQGFSGNWSNGTISAGGSQVVTVTFAPTEAISYPGTITVASNKTSGTNTIACSGTGIEEQTRVIRLEGQDNLSFGDVTVNTTATKTLTIYNDGNDTLPVTDIAYPAGFSGSWSNGTISAGGSQNVTVTFSPTEAISYGGTITVTCDSTSGDNTIACSGTGIEDQTRVIRLEGQDNLSFGDVTVNTTATKTLTIYNDGNDTLPVTDIAYPAGFSGNWSNGTIGAGGFQDVTLTFAPTEAISYGGTITVTCDSTSGDNTIACSGTGVEGQTRVIQLSGDLAFGEVIAGQTSQRTLTIYNDGTGTLTVTDIHFPLCFSGDWDSGEVPASGSQDVHVTFSPSQAMNYGGTITVDSDKTDGTDTIYCSGTGKPNSIPKIAAGQYFTAAIKSDGTLWSWGSNAYGQLGDGTTTNQYSPVQIGGDTDWRDVTSGGWHTVAIKSDGTLWAWGGNYNGQLGDGTTTDRYSPVQIGEDTDWSAITAGRDHTLAVKSDGTLWAWGWNANGQLGDGTTTDRYSPVQIGEDTDWSAIAAGWDYSLAVKSDGTLWAWGDNYNGQLGDGTNDNRHSPVRIGEDNWSTVAAGYKHTVAVKSDGTLWAWGYNNYGPENDEIWFYSNVPVQIGSDNAWNKVAAGYEHSFAVKTDGTLWAWGWNANGQIGDGTQTDRQSPVQVGTGWSTVAAGYGHTVGAKQDSSLWTWGRNMFGQLGNGAIINRHTPLHIGNSIDWTPISAGGMHNVAVKTDGSLWAWGYNNYGQIGNGTQTDIYSPSQIGSNIWCNVSAGYNHTVAVNTDGTLWGWGNGEWNKIWYQLPGYFTCNPVQIGSDNDWSKVTAGDLHTVAIKTDGTLWAWGGHFDGACPHQHGSDSDWNAIDAGGCHSVALKTDGTLWAWGSNDYGQLGDGTQAYSFVPVKIGSDTWSKVAAGSSHTVAVKSDGTLWAWGWNANGQLGDGTTTDRHSPVKIGSDSWSTVAAGSRHTVAVKSDGTLWAWGYNHYGQLGDGTETDRYLPVQIGTDEDWCTVAAGYHHTVAVKTDGTLWAWGNNGYSQLGNGTVTVCPNPCIVPERIISLSGTLVFGDVTVGESAQKMLTIHNSGNETLMVTDINCPPGFSVDWSSGSVSAGGSQNVAVTFAPTEATSYPGTIAVTCDSTFGDKTIECSGRGVSALTRVVHLVGEDDLCFGEVEIGSETSKTLWIYNEGTDTLTVSSINYPTGFSGSWNSGTMTISSGGSRTVTVTFTPTEAKSYNDTITVNSDKTEGDNTIDCSGNGCAPSTRIIRLTGDLAFGSVMVGQTSQRTLTIHNDGNGALNISGISSTATEFSGNWTGTISAGGSQNVIITFAPGAATNYSGTITVDSDKTSGTDTIACSGTGSAPSTRIIRLTGDLAFGSVTVGQTSQRTLTIHNDGNGALNISGISFTATEFSGNWTGTISAGGSQNVIITFAPGAATNYSGTITVNSDKTSGTDTIICSGAGVSGGITLQYSWNMNTDPDWNTDGLWAWGQPAGGGGSHGNPDPTSGYTGSNVYGYNLSGDYENLLPERHLTTSAINCTGLSNVTLKFQRWLGVEEPSYDHAYIRISNDGSTWSNVWENSATITDSSWSLQEFDISSVADGQPAVYVRWTMGTTDGSWQYCGWNIDDVEIWGIGTGGTQRIIRLSGNVAFGNVTVGQSSQRTLTIYNDGNSPLAVSGITCPPGFSGNWSGTISAGGSRSVSVSFAPESATNYGGTITVNSDKTSGTNTISCSGTGIGGGAYTILEDDFEDGDVNGWQNYASTSFSATSTYSASGSYCGKHTSAGDKFAPSYMQFQSQNGAFTIEYDFMTPEKGDDNYWKFLTITDIAPDGYYNGYPYTSFLVGISCGTLPGGYDPYGFYYSSNGTWYYTGVQFATYEWNHFRFDIDVATQTYDLYINSILIDEDIPFYRSADSISYFHISSEYATCYVDNVIIRSTGRQRLRSLPFLPLLLGGN